MGATPPQLTITGTVRSPTLHMFAQPSSMVVSLVLPAPFVGTIIRAPLLGITSTVYSPKANLAIAPSLTTLAQSFPALQANLYARPGVVALSAQLPLATAVLTSNALVILPTTVYATITTRTPTVTEGTPPKGFYFSVRVLTSRSRFVRVLVP